jgi:Fe-S oxidoreductase
VKHSVEIFYEYLKDGRIKVDPDKKITEPATYQDPCNLSRSGGLWEKARWLMDATCTDFRDMSPNREYNHCCGGGGGYIPMGPDFRKRRLISGKVKVDQIRETGAKVLIVPCHNCYDQINDLNKEYELGLKVMHFKTIISEMMIIPDEMKPDEEE